MVRVRAHRRRTRYGTTDVRRHYRGGRVLMSSDLIAFMDSRGAKIMRKKIKGNNQYGLYKTSGGRYALYKKNYYNSPRLRDIGM